MSYINWLRFSSCSCSIPLSEAVSVFRWEKRLDRIRAMVATDSRWSLRICNCNVLFRWSVYQPRQRAIIAMTSASVESLKFIGFSERDNGNVHRAAAKIIVSKSRATRGSVCNVLLSTALSSFQCCFGLRVSSAKPAAVINAETIIRNEISRVNCRREYHRQRSSSQLLMSSGSFPPDFDKPSSPVE